ncbi:MAG: Mur ligase domain-containing protein, partial [Candidatus Methylomirabilaceae bacterium]
MTVRLAMVDVIRATGGRLVQPADAHGTGPDGASHPGGRFIPEVITGVQTDSRQVTPCDLFVALRGPNADGHAFVVDAFARGAALAVVKE